MADVIHEDEGCPPVSERVQSLAKSVYDELEVLINNYGPECIGNLMPLVVSILENLDSALSDNQDNLNAVMELTDENQQLLSQYEKEKQQKKEIEEKAMLLEESSEYEIARLKEVNATLSLENRSLSNKIKSQTEQIEKLDDRHEQLKAEYRELHEKNLVLVKENIRESVVASKLSSAKNREEAASTPVITAPGFQDFTASSKSKKKRQQPSLPVQSHDPMLSLDDATTPAAYLVQSPVDLTPLPTFSTEVTIEEDEQEESEDIMNLTNNESMEDVSVNDQSLFAELGESNSLMSFTGLDDILMENKQLHTDKETLSMELETLTRAVSELKIEKAKLENEKEDFTHRLEENDAELRKIKKELQESRRQTNEAAERAKGLSDGEGLRISRLEIAKVLRERNEWKEKYFSLLEQVRMNDELYLFKRKDRKSRWVDYFTALFSSTRRRQLEQSLIESSAHRPILTPGADTNSSVANQNDFESQNAVFTGAGYSKTNLIPTLKRVGKKDDEVFMTSICWVVPSLLLSDSNNSPIGSPVNPVPVAPNINTCRPMSFQEEGEKIFCAIAINQATFLSDCNSALSISKGSEMSAASDEKSMSLVWICTGNDNLSKVSVLDTAAVGEVLETFAVCSSPLTSIAAVPSFDEKDPDVLSSLSTKTKKRASSGNNPERPSSSLATVWMGSDTGVLYVHSAVLQWKKCLHADKLIAGIQDIVHSKGKVFIVLQNGTLAVFRRFPDGEWDWDNYEIITISQKKSVTVTAVVAVKYNIWCAVGNSIHVLHSHHFRSEANFTVHASKSIVVSQMLTVGDGVWVSFKNDSLLRLFHATSFAHMQDLDVSPSVHKTVAFGSEKRSNQMPVPVTCVVAAQNSLWIGTENGIIMNFPFSHPAIVAEETGWEVIKEAEVSGQEVPEPFDVKTEEALDASVALSSTNSKVTSHSKDIMESKKSFTPFCNIDQVHLSIHCHVNAVTSLVCVPGLVPEDMSMYEPVEGVYIASGDSVKYRPSLFVMSCGEGHLDLRTADKVMQTLHAQETGRSGIPMAASVISKKNYIMVWDIVV